MVQDLPRSILTSLGAHVPSWAVSFQLQVRTGKFCALVQPLMLCRPLEMGHQYSTPHRRLPDVGVWLLYEPHFLLIREEGRYHVTPRVTVGLTGIRPRPLWSIAQMSFSELVMHR